MALHLAEDPKLFQSIRVVYGTRFNSSSQFRKNVGLTSFWRTSTFGANAQVQPMTMGIAFCDASWDGRLLDSITETWLGGKFRKYQGSALDGFSDRMVTGPACT